MRKNEEKKVEQRAPQEKCSRIHFTLTVVKLLIYAMSRLAVPSGAQLPVRLSKQRSTPGLRPRLVIKQPNSYREGTTRYHRERDRLLRPVCFFLPFFFLVSSLLPPSCLVGVSLLPVTIGGSPWRGRGQRSFTFCPTSGTGPSSGTDSWCPTGYTGTMSCSSNRWVGGRNCLHDECNSSFV